MTKVLSLWRGWIGQAPAPSRTAAGIVRAVAEAHGLTLEDLRAAGRRAGVARARQEAMAMLRAQTGTDGRPRYSFPWIARFFRVSHPTVIHGVRAHHARAPDGGDGAGDRA